MRLSLACLSLLAACDLRPNPEATCTLDDAVMPGHLIGTLDGADWNADEVTWLFAGDSLQINTGTEEGWRLSIVAQTDNDGATVKSVMDAGNYPVHVAFGEGAGGFVTVYTKFGSSSYSTNNTAGGVFEILRMDEDEGVVGCLSFEAATDEGEVVTLDAGSLRAIPSGS